ncbi:DUF3549 family protein [Celerinatantimonas diazotrophica]|uniref:Uncharacterized protein DUF3549 n=1 Tax=Celerinatantimonas diazotrophica TaxID=412034 RepID=A0A4R1J9J3_9GAMM|nr:DUF3549 family protein [Celerinatantimonas diazotrophica]TCK47276.1 uncharacterized protein DUF3549 [Celerinatantimonas diazotrophica]CAG9296048.1 hypothetical protein CEDIAZO_01187 [Celerinatantimonas diazotrophica]
MKALSTLSEILTLAGSQFKVYDMGRRITPIDTQAFYAMETAVHPYPAPIAGHARLALCFWSIKAPETPYIWFLQFPVDEQGFIKLAARDQFLNLIVTILGHDLSQKPTDEQAKVLANNPCIFNPSEEKKAYFNARLKVDLDLPASVYYEHAQSYLAGELGWENWTSIALQGLADVVARLDREDNSQRLAHAFEHLNDEIWVHLTQLLEHQNLDQKLCHKLCELHGIWLKERPQLSYLLLRAMASSQQKKLRQKALKEQLEISSDPQLFVAIAGRLWSDLEEEELNRLFFEQLAKIGDQMLFNQLFADLVAIPKLRNQVLSRLRDPQRGKALAEAIGQLIQSAHG